MIYERKYPQFIKYMGSKSKIMNFVLEGINGVIGAESPPTILDLFAGSASLAGAIGNQTAIVSNDIQSYSGILSHAYVDSYFTDATPTSNQLLNEIELLVTSRKSEYAFEYHYHREFTLKDFVELEILQQKLIKIEATNNWHLFYKYYSGTWWSAEQCIYIDAIREITEHHINTPHYNVLLSCLMYAMAYTSQGTGHYAQYRDAKTESSLKDILIYRRRSVLKYFLAKYIELINWIPNQPPGFTHRHTNLDFEEALNTFEGGLIYADPPYCFVHYSRFYHAIETIVKYDYPTLQTKAGKLVKGRYREERHQSPFCIKSQVRDSFVRLFNGVQTSNSQLVLSYSNTGMITLEELSELASEIFGTRRKEVLFTDHKHMTLGRKQDRDRDVKECLILIY
ncbi:MAG: DNA adenine methylase [Burkholderiales bacterium]|nr:DNA adenine methylase [Burkholderiales bacterium]